MEAKNESGAWNGHGSGPQAATREYDVKADPRSVRSAVAERASNDRIIAYPPLNPVPLGALLAGLCNAMEIQRSQLNWLHRHLTGECGVDFKELSGDDSGTFTTLGSRAAMLSHDLDLIIAKLLDVL